MLFIEDQSSRVEKSKCVENKQENRLMHELLAFNREYIGQEINVSENGLLKSCHSNKFHVVHDNPPPTVRGNVENPSPQFNERERIFSVTFAGLIERGRQRAAKYSISGS